MSILIHLMKNKTNNMVVVGSSIFVNMDEVLILIAAGKVPYVTKDNEDVTVDTLIKLLCRAMANNSDKFTVPELIRMINRYN